MAEPDRQEPDKDIKERFFIRAQTIGKEYKPHRCKRRAFFVFFTDRLFPVDDSFFKFNDSQIEWKKKENR